MQLLSFGNAMVVGPRQREKLFRILNMYEVLIELLPDINSLYSSQASDSVRQECYKVLRRLGDAVRATFLELQLQKMHQSIFLLGARYVMNYIKLLTYCSDILNHILEEAEREECLSLLSDSAPSADKENQTDSSCNNTSMSSHF